MSNNNEPKTVFTSKERRELAGRARTLHERKDGIDNVPVGEPKITPERILTAWREQFPDERTFQDRLAHEGLTRGSIETLTAATHWPPDEPLPAWVSYLESIIAFVESEEATPAIECTETPFQELLSVIAAFAHQELPESIPEKALGPLLEGLIDRLRKLCVRPLYVEFKMFVRNRGGTSVNVDHPSERELPTELYDEFTDSLFEGRFRTLCLDYPVPGRQLSAVVYHWTEAVTEMYSRLVRDRPTLYDVFDVTGEVTSIYQLADDTHDGGRTPMRISFEEGSVIYKPRPVDGGVSFYSALDRLGDHVSTPDHSIPRYLPRDGYGWMENVEETDLRDHEEARAYYLRAGVVLCLGYVLGLTDCQKENVIAAGEHPTIIDLETILTPGIAPAERPGSDVVATVVNRSVLSTGLLPYRTNATGEDALGPATVAGFGTNSSPTELSEMAIPSIRHVNTDLMTVVKESPTVTTEANTPTTSTEDCPPERYVGELVTGFREAHRSIRSLAGDDEFFGRVFDPGSLERSSVRYLFRNTGMYSSVLRSATSRAALRDGLRLSVEFERLAAELFKNSNDPSRWWPLYAAEQNALKRRDVPRFTVHPERRSIFHDGEKTGVHVDATGFERCQSRVCSLDQGDETEQVAILHQTFDPNQSGNPGVLSRPPDGFPPSDDRLLHEAASLFEDTLDARVETGAGKDWISAAGAVPLHLIPADETLYIGKSGIAMVAASLYDATGTDRYERIASVVLEDVHERVESTPDQLKLGGLRGIGSVIYACTVIAELLEDAEIQEKAEELTTLVTPERAAADEYNDVMNGTAGAILGLLAFYDRFGDQSVLNRAVEAGEQLLAARTVVDGHGVWETQIASGPVVGFAHGQSGIAYALARLADAVAEPEFASAARDALKYESANPGVVGRPDIDRLSDRIPDWCRGEPGRALARCWVGEYLDDDQLIADGKERLAAIESASPSPIDNLCCGNFGRADVLLEANHRLGYEVRDGSRLIGRCLARQDEHGRLELPGHSRVLPNITFFDGISGVAYELLRHRSPDRYPCVLRFE